MNDNEINIAIAEACGWVAMPDGPDYLPPGSLKTQMVPSYTTDLNAMHEAERVLPAKHWDRYTQWMAELAGGTRRFVVCHATAAQRAEAFLRTLGKWKD